MHSHIEHSTLAERLRTELTSFSQAERGLARLLLSDANADDVATVAALAARAGVSQPTVIRFVKKIQFEFFCDFRDFAQQDIAQRRESALRQMQSANASAYSVATHLNGLKSAVSALLEGVNEAEFTAAIALIGDTSKRQLFLGGRFSQSVAEQLYRHLDLIRTGCELIGSGNFSAGRVLNISRGHVLTVFDFRRYQSSTVQFATEAKKRRSKIVLITDRWMSPIADFADVVLVVPVTVGSPFDSLVGALALTELLIGAVYEDLGNAAIERLSEHEELSASFEWSGTAYSQKRDNDDGV